MSKERYSMIRIAILRMVLAMPICFQFLLIILQLLIMKLEYGRLLVILVRTMSIGIMQNMILMTCMMIQQMNLTCF